MSVCTEPSPKRARLGQMLGNIERYSDVVFVVGAEPAQRFPANRIIFAQASEVFDRMLFQDVAGVAFLEQASTNTEIRIEDVTPQAFEQVQRWVHGLSPTLDISNAFAIAQAADKYAMDDLQLQVQDWLSESMSSPDMVAKLYDVPGG